ncbi:MAG: choice-of-anchor tandem repeat GloVer-containing protein [Terriglobales bacterium]
MRRNKFWDDTSRILLAVAVTLVVTLMLVPGAGACGKYKTLYKFKGGKDGNEYVNLGPFIEYFSTGLVFDAVGNLYGTTPAGGAYGHGVVFELAPAADGRWKETVLHRFTGGKDGASPMTSLIFDAAGNLYGTTFGGGHYGMGTVFRLTPTSSGGWKERVLHSFTGGKDGASPMVGVIFDGSGNLYGATDGGGAYGQGNVFKLSPNADGSWTENVLHAFTGGWDGSPQVGGLVFDPAGNLYGTAQGGTAGVVFRLSPNSDGSWADTVLHNFTYGDGWDPFSFSGLLLDAAGNIYGTAFWDKGTGGGVVFELTPNLDGSWSETAVYSFTGGVDGEHPEAGVIFGADGNLYGTTLFGGEYDCYHGPYSDGCGVVFKLSRKPDGSWKEGVLHTFVDRPGAHPFAGLIRDAAGNLYGTTSGDGSTTFGSVYEITF